MKPYTRINLLNSMLSRTQGVMFKVKQLFTENHYFFWTLCSFKFILTALRLFALEV